LRQPSTTAQNWNGGSSLQSRLHYGLWLYAALWRYGSGSSPYILWNASARNFCHLFLGRKRLVFYDSTSKPIGFRRLINWIAKAISSHD